MKKTYWICTITAMVAAAVLFAACNTSVNNINNGNSSTGSSSGTPAGTSGSKSTPDETEEYTANVSSRNIATDDSASVTWENTLYINLTAVSCSSDNSNWTEITSEEATVLTDGNGNAVTAVYDSTSGGLTVTSSKSSAALQVVVSGSAEKLHLIFNNKKNVNFGVTLNDAVINSTGNYPAITFNKNAKVYLTVEGTNSITDGRTYGYGYGEEYSTSASDTYTDSDGNAAYCTVSANPVSDGDDTKGTIYTKGALLMNGTGTLTLTEGYKHGIYSKDYIRVFGGNWEINSSGRNGIQTVNGFIMEDGTITITGTGNKTNNQSRGIIVEGEESTDYPGEGYILINGGEINITTVSKGMSAKWDIDEDYEGYEDGETNDTADDPNPYVRITGGTITVKTTGTPVDESSRSYTFTDADGVSVSETTKLSPEGIEGKQAVYIEGGELNLTCTDDCINASRSGSAELLVKGGKIYAYSSDNDAMDSNGTFTISGGTIVSMTSTNPECAFDCDNYTFTITGGTFIGIGTSNYSTPTSSVCTQSTIVLSGDYLGTTGKTFTIGTSQDSPVFAYTIDSSIFSSMNSNYVAILSSPAIQTGTSYTLYNSATVSGGEAFHGLYTSMPDVSSATSKATGISTSSSSYVYTLSSSSNGGAQEGTHTNPWDSGSQTGGGFGR